MLLFQSLCWRNCRPELFRAAVPMSSAHPPCLLPWFRTQLQCKDTFWKELERVVLTWFKIGLDHYPAAIYSNFLNQTSICHFVRCVCDAVDSFWLGPPGLPSVHVLGRQTQHSVRFLLPQTPPPPRLANACVKHAAIQAFRQRSYISIWKAVFNELLELSVYLRNGCLGVFEGGIRGFLWRFPVNAYGLCYWGWRCF